MRPALKALVDFLRKERRGVVVSSAGDKSITVRVDSAKPHPKYQKIVRRSTRLHAHDERNEAHVGDVVRIVETRPLSKLKRWRVAEVMRKTVGAAAEIAEPEVDTPADTGPAAGAAAYTADEQEEA